MADIRTLPVTQSTNEEVAALARTGASEGLWVRAETQTGGRGRQGRPWSSPPGNLYASTLVRLRPGDPPAATLALLAPVALEQVVAAYSGPGRVKIKWPNDLVAACSSAALRDQSAPAKLAGILLERTGDVVVIGFGVNLAHHPLDLDRPATSIAALTGAAPNPSAFAVDLADSVAQWLGRWRGEGIGPVRARWLDRAHPAGTALVARLSDGEAIEGLFEGLDRDGALRLRTPGGERLIHAGDVFLI